MKTGYADIDGYWGVVLCYEYSLYDADEMAGIMDSFGMDDVHIREAMNTLFSTNTGMCVSRSDIRMSAVFISEASSPEQWADTLVHEIDHVQDMILSYYGVPQGTEEAAWLQGYIMREVVKALNKKYQCVCYEKE